MNNTSQNLNNCCSDNKASYKELKKKISSKEVKIFYRLRKSEQMRNFGYRN